MSTVNNPSPINDLVGMRSATKSSPSKELGQDEFLKLMIAQFASQDPFQPQENGDFLAQLAQFSTNDGITKMQASIEHLASSLQSSQALQASALVGQKVMVNNNIVNLGNEGGITAAVDLPSNVSNLTAAIYSSSGELVHKIPLGQQNAGLFQFNWDGKDGQGGRVIADNYKIEVTGIYGGREVAIKTLTAANVDSVTLGQNGEGLKLNVAGIGAISLDQVRQITV